MYSLNERIEDSSAIVCLGSDLDSEHLFSDQLPEAYSYDDYCELGNAFVTLLSEIREHTKAKRIHIRIKTALEDKVQKIEIAWNGTPLADDVIKSINERYKEGAESKSPPMVRGTKIAGYVLNQYGGNICIENFVEGEYRVRNIIQIPCP